MKAGFQPNVVYKSAYWDFLTEMVRHNLGISIFPQSLAKKVDLRSIRVIPIVNPPIVWKLGIIIKKEKYVSYAAREMVKYITASL